MRWLVVLVAVAVLVQALRTVARAPAGPPPPPEPPAWDPWGVLGVRRGAGPNEITRAYREQMKRYHPDRVADLGDDLQQLAHAKVLDIQRAYRELIA